MQPVHPNRPQRERPFHPLKALGLSANLGPGQEVYLEPRKARSPRTFLGFWVPLLKSTTGKVGTLLPTSPLKDLQGTRRAKNTLGPQLPTSSLGSKKLLERHGLVPLFLGHSRPSLREGI